MVSEQMLSRRLVLRRALAIGCSLCVPVGLSGCDSDKGAATPHAAPADAAAKSETTAAPPASAKVPQANAQYQTQPKGEQQCSGCVHFVAEANTCHLVEGEISPEGWCILWAKKI